jgi:phospholipid/cholesterol/gamma-HCH transport system substrate-binding protein
MTPRSARNAKITLAVLLVAALIGGVALVANVGDKLNRTYITAYFDNSNGLFVGDEVRILGVPVGAIDAIEPQPDQVKIRLHVDAEYKVPADVKAAILSPQLVTARAIQLTPPYSGGPALRDDAVIPRNRTVVPLEWDDLRQQLEKLTDALQPTQPGGVNSLGEFINTAADNLRGQGPAIRDAVVKMAQAFSILDDHSTDLFSTLNNLSVVVSALHDSSSVLASLNRNLAGTTALLTNDPNEVGQAISDINTAIIDTTTFIADNREALGTSTDKLSSISKALYDSLDDIKQTLHVAPNAFQNYVNIYQPSQASFSGALAVANFNNPITFLCGAIQAASRLGAEQSAKLCAQYLAPIVKNRQFNFLPFGENAIVGESARPNELTYTEDWMRPDYVPGPPPPASDTAPSAGAPDASTGGGPLPAEGGAPNQTADPTQGLPGMMMPIGAGS